MNTPVSKINTIITKNYLQNQPENQYFERKGLGEKDMKATKIAEELIGMLNADGGVLAFGVSDDGKFQDLKQIADKLDEYRKLAFDFIQPPCNIQLEEIEIDGNLIFLFHVEQDLERIYSRKDNNKVFLRVADSNRELDREQIQKLEYGKKNTSCSEINTIITKNYLQNQPENQYFERKGLGEKDMKATKIAEELIGMLNADGGVLAFGVSDDGKFQDLKQIADKLDEYRKLAFDFIQPPCNIQLEEIEIDGNLIFLFHVEQDLERIYSRKDNDKVFLRVADSNRELDREQIKKLEYDKNIRHFEEEVINEFDEDDLDYKLLAEYQQKINFKDNVFDLLYKKYLVKKNAGNYQFTKAGVLLFAKDPERYIPTASVRYIRYDGVSAKAGVEHNVIKDQRFENNIPRLIDELTYFIRASLRDYYFLNLQQGKFQKVPEYPEEAWLEGVVNALCHRSYNVQGNSIYIKHFDDRIEISNSGPLPAQVTTENIKTERFARNPRIARVLEDLGYVRQLNEGVSRIYESMEKSLLAQPEYREQNGNVYLTLRNRVSSHEKAISPELMANIENAWASFNETQQTILHYLFINGVATLSDLVEYTRINANSIRSYLNQFVAQNLIERHSQKQRDPNAKYTLKRD